MEWQDSLLFKLIADFLGNYICALLLEKGVSILQNRKFNRRYALGFFLILLTVKPILNGI